jgi:hypothetical protein
MFNESLVSLKNLLGEEMDISIKYIELKTDGVRGIGKIAKVSFSKSGKTIYYAGRKLSSLKGFAAKANYFDEDTYEEFWISNPRNDGKDSLFPAIIEIDDDAREEYWNIIRKEPENTEKVSYKSPGKSKNEIEAVEKSVRRHDIDRRFRAP